MAATWRAIAAAATVSLSFGAGAGSIEELAFLQAVTVPGGETASLVSPVEVLVSPDGAFVFVLTNIDAGDDAVQVYHRQSDGTLVYADTYAPGFGNPTAMALTPDGTALFVVDNNGGVHASRRAADTGALTGTDSVYDGASPELSHLQSARGVAVSPDGAHVFVGSAEGALTVLAWNGVAGTLSWLELVLDGADDADLLGDPTSIAFSPDGLVVFVAAVVENGLTVFDRDPSGQLGWNRDFVGGFGGLDGLGWPSDLAIAPAGLSLYASGRLDGTVARFTADGQGNAVYADATPVGSQPFALALHPAGTRLYVTDEVLDRVAAIERDPVTGALGAEAGAITDADPGVNGLSNPYAIAVSPGGENLYVAAAGDEAVSVFALPAPEPHAGLLAAVTVAAMVALRRSWLCCAVL